MERNNISRKYVLGEIFSKIFKPALAFLSFLSVSFNCTMFTNSFCFNYSELLLQHGKRRNGINRINLVTRKSRSLPFQLYHLTAFVVHTTASS